jgi:soluble lytic murein transglycosylase-like protein
LLLPPLAVLLVSGLLALFAYSPFVTASASSYILPQSTLSSLSISLPSSSGYAQTNISPIFTPEVQYWGTRLQAWSAEFGFDPNLAATVMQIESCGYERALSRSGAIGLFQVMPFHFSASDSPFDPDTNARRGLAYLAQSLQRAGGNPRLALAGYNGGIGVIGRSEASWSSQTNRYVYYGGAIYADAVTGFSASNALNEWYLKYGVSLCKQAHDALGLP